jgi:predicted protein tyrosine phosphatase
MSVDIFCRYFDVNVKFHGNEWIVGDETGITLSSAAIIDNLSAYYHRKFLEWSEEDLRKRNARERKPMTMERYLKLGLGDQYEWMEQKSRDVLKLKDFPGVEFYLI